MNRILVGLGKLAIASSGPSLIIYSTVLFDRYFDAGAQTPDATYSIKINNHGTYRYITEAQDREISIFLGLGAMLLVVLFAMIYRKLRKGSE